MEKGDFFIWAGKFFGKKDILRNFQELLGLREKNLREDESELFKDYERGTWEESSRFDHSFPYVLHFSFILCYFDDHTLFLVDVWMLALIL